MKTSCDLEEIELEMLNYANKDELANQVIRRVNSGSDLQSDYAQRKLR